jgi:hypothetical protein
MKELKESKELKEIKETLRGRSDKLIVIVFSRSSRIIKNAILVISFDSTSLSSQHLSLLNCLIFQP